MTEATNWVMPSDADLKDEYEEEYLLPRRNWPSRSRTIGATYPLFKDLQDFIAQVKSATVAPITSSRMVHNLTDLGDIDDIKAMVAGYSKPRDVDRIVAGFEAGVAMPLPIIISGPKGNWILSGNTRANVASVMGIQPEALWVRVQ